MLETLAELAGLRRQRDCGQRGAVAVVGVRNGDRQTIAWESDRARWEVLRLWLGLLWLAAEGDSGRVR